jgi:hypothetical protein
MNLNFVLVLATVSLTMTACQRRHAPVPDEAPAPVRITDEASANLAFSTAVGTWDWESTDSTCLGNTHTISFSPDRSTMTLTFVKPLDAETGERDFHYRVIAAGEGAVPGFPHSILAAMEGETRRTESGELVIWGLLLATQNRYHWHRTDWPETGVTHAVVRCRGKQPLERWGGGVARPPASIDLLPR